MKKAVSLALAAIMTASTGIVAYADTADSAVKNKLTTVKSRIEIPEEFSEFDYSVYTISAADVYSFNWTTGQDSDFYGKISCSICGSVITSYNVYRSDYVRRSSSAKLADMSKSELYGAAVKAVKQLNPTVADSISIDEDSISMSVYSNTATFRLTRTNNKIPVANDTGSITIDKNTGELISFNISWHPNASFQSTDRAISTDKAWDGYEKMAAIKPRYEIYYNSDSKGYESRLVYVQTDYGDINALTGKKSNFQEDAYFDEYASADEAYDNAAVSSGTGGMSFTKNELKELGIELPYGTENAVVDLIKGNKYLTYSDGMTLEHSSLSKGKYYGNTDRYMFTVYFINEGKEDYWEDEPMPLTGSEENYTQAAVSSYEFMGITVDAQTGEVLDYCYYTDAPYADSYDMTKADNLAKEIAENLAPSHIDEYTGYSSNIYQYNSYGDTRFTGSHHNFNREVNGITVSGNNISISLDSQMRLTNYSVYCSDVEFADTKNMLTAEQAFEKFRENNELTLCYKVKTGDKVTASVMVYSCDNTVYCDAFTGEPVYSGYSASENDLSGIKDKKLLQMATVLDDNGVIISSDKFKENDAVKLLDYAGFISLICTSYEQITDDVITLPSGIKTEAGEDSYDGVTVTRGDAMVLYTIAICGNRAAELKGIYRSPFTDVKDTDKYVGYYSIAYALGAVDVKTLDPSASYTYADMIELMYNSMK